MILTRRPSRAMERHPAEEPAGVGGRQHGLLKLCLAVASLPLMVNLIVRAPKQSSGAPCKMTYCEPRSPMRRRSARPGCGRRREAATAAIRRRISAVPEGWNCAA